MTQEQIQEWRSFVVALAYRLLEKDTERMSLLEVSGRQAYDRIGWYVQQEPYASVADWYLTAKGAEVSHFMKEWSAFLRVQRFLSQM